MNIFQFMSESPWLTFFLFLIVGTGIAQMGIRAFRAININKHGWPPPHCDADGDLKPEPENDESE